MFLFGITFLTLEKSVSTLLGSRVRGMFQIQSDSLYSTRILRSIPMFVILGQVINIIWFYKLAKKFNSIKYVISYTRVQSRITGYICQVYVPVCFRAPMFGLFSFIYGVKIDEATRRFSEYTTFTDFFTRHLRPG